jgi:hypothetical protein
MYVASEDAGGCLAASPLVALFAVSALTAGCAV